MSSHGPRKRLYRHRIRCEKCQKEINSDNKAHHIEKQHKGQDVKFTVVQDKKQKLLDFGLSKSSTSKSEGQLIENIDVSDLMENDPEVEDITDTNSDLPNLAQENAQSKTQSQITVKPIHDKNEVLIDDKNISYGESSHPTSNQYSPQKFNKEGSLQQITHQYSPQKSDNDGPSHPKLKEYSPQKFGKETFVRDFRLEWFKDFPWISFSIETKESFCYACDVYSLNTSFKFTNWKKPERLKKHATSEAHCTAMLNWANAKINEKMKNTILTQLDSQHKVNIKKNRQYLKIIIETLMFTAQQNISQRGHEESRQNISEISNINRGNFLELLSLRCRDLPWLQNMFTEKLENKHQWTSPIIQNELLAILADQVVMRIVKDVQESEMFAIILDETSDISRIEQVSLCLSYVADGIKKETFVGFYETKSTEGEVLYELVKKAACDLNLDLQNVVGKCFDGASNMFGIYKGLATRMKECSPLSIYIHCYAHLLNLAIQGTIVQIEPLRKTLGQIQSLYNFIEASPKRHAIFNDIKIDGKLQVRTLKSLSMTRWSCHCEGVKAVDDEL